MTTISRTYAHNELELACHVRNPGSNSNITIDVDGTVYEFEVAPTIDWVASSTAAGANKILINILPNMSNFDTKNYSFDFKIKVENNDVLVCSYRMSRGTFSIIEQPVWNETNFQPYDITGHIQPAVLGAESGNISFGSSGSLQILSGQTVEFRGMVSPPLSVFGPR
jgi:hypothetical protein